MRFRGWGKGRRDLEFVVEAIGEKFKGDQRRRRWGMKMGLVRDFVCVLNL